MINVRMCQWSFSPSINRIILSRIGRRDVLITTRSEGSGLITSWCLFGSSRRTTLMRIKSALTDHLSDFFLQSFCSFLESYFHTTFLLIRYYRWGWDLFGGREPILLRENTYKYTSSLKLWAKCDEATVVFFSSELWFWFLSLQASVRWWSEPTGRRGAGRTSGTAWPSRTSGSWSWRRSWLWLRRWPTTASTRRVERRPTAPPSARTRSPAPRPPGRPQRPKEEEEENWETRWRLEGSSPSSGPRPPDPPTGPQREEVRSSMTSWSAGQI